MKNKIILVILIIVFIVIISFLNTLLKKETEKKINIENKILSNEEESEMIIGNNENFESEVLKSDKTVLIDFYADWCGPCQMLSPIVKDIANEHDDIKVVKINIDEEQELAIKYDVMSIPTLVVIKNGKEANRIVGLVGKEEIEKILK